MYPNDQTEVASPSVTITASEVSKNLSEALTCARDRMEFISRKRAALQTEFEQAVDRFEGEREMLTRLMSGLEVALGMNEAKCAPSTAAASDVRMSQLRNA